MLDVDKANLNEVANAVVEEMVNTGQIRAEDQGNILKVLLSKHKYVGFFSLHYGIISDLSRLVYLLGDVKSLSSNFEHQNFFACVELNWQFHFQYKSCIADS